MEVKVLKKGQYENASDTLALAYYEGIRLPVEIPGMDEEAETMINHLVKEEVFSGKFGEIQSFRIVRDKNPRTIILAGLGKENEINVEKIRKVSAKVFRECGRLKSKCLGVYPIGINDGISFEESAKASAEGFMLAEYKFTCYKSDKKETLLKEIVLISSDDKNAAKLRKGLKEGITVAESVMFARNLVNEPANVLTPAELAERAARAGSEAGFEVEIFDEARIKELKMEAFHEVAKGAENPPRLIVMRYFGNKDNKDNILGLVGKGLTYDSGGYALKPTEGMVNMKSDMAGSAAVVGAMTAIAKSGLKANVVGVVAACENMISGKAYRNGDIIGSMGGKTIEIKSTDAEGRLTLADAVHYIIEKEGADRVVDIATLTGAALVALGNTTTAVVSNNDEFYGKLESASKKSGEKVWRLPAFDEYRELIKSDIADLKNTGGRYAGTITGGLFIGEFVLGRPWIHMDIAGTSGSDKEEDYTSKGGTGVGVMTLYELVKILF